MSQGIHALAGAPNQLFIRFAKCLGSTGYATTAFVARQSARAESSGVSALRSTIKST